MKRTILIASITILILTLLPINNAMTLGQGVTLTFEEAIQEIKEQDIDLIINDLNVEITDLRKNYTPSPASRTQWGMTYNFIIAVKLSDAQDAQSDYQTLSNTLQKEYTTTSTLYQYWLASENYKIQQEAYDLSKKELANIQRKYEIGTVSKMEVSQAQISTNRAKIDRDQALQNQKALQYNINKSLNQDIHERLTITNIDYNQLEGYKPLENTSADEIITEHASLEALDLTVEAYAEGNKALENMKDDQVAKVIKDWILKEQELAEKNKDNHKQTLEILTTRYLDQFANFQESLKLTQENVKLSEETYKTQNVLYDNGMTTQLDLERSRIGLLQNKLALADLKNNYMLLIKEFELFQQGYISQR